MRKQWILFLLLGTSIAISNAQNQERLEFDLRPNEPQPEIVPIESQGFIIFNPAKERKEDGIAHMALSFYDTSFKKIWEKDVASNKKLNLTFYEHFEDTFYLIFSNSSKEILEVATIEPASGNITHYEFYVVKGTDIQDFVVHQNQLIIGGTIKNMPLIQKMDLNTQKTITLPSIVEGKQVSVNELFINEKTNQVSAVISSSFDKTKNVIVRTFGNERNQFEDLVITSDQNYDFHTAKITEISKEEKLVMGSYGFRNSANTQGFYMAKFINFQQEFLRFYSFTDLNNFFSFLSEKQQTKTEDRVERKKNKGKDLRIQYRLLMHELEKQNDQYVMVGEAYYPTYRQERYIQYYGLRRYYSYRTVFDGNQFTHAVIAGFDKNGALLWDHSFKINDIKTMNLKEKVKSYVAPNNITLFYNLEGQIRKLSIRDNQIDKVEETLSLQTEFRDDQVKRADIGSAEYWYDNYFIAWGYQKIKNENNQDVKKKRNIFYINKMSF